MDRVSAPRRRAFARFAWLGLMVLPLLADPAGAQPPIKSQRDAACRDHARAHVFSTPDPQNVGLHEIGRRLYMRCMGTARGGRARRASR